MITMMMMPMMISMISMSMSIKRRRRRRLQIIKIGQCKISKNRLSMMSFMAEVEEQIITRETNDTEKWSNSEK